MLMQFEYPMTLTLIQLVTISILSEPLLRLTYRGSLKSDRNGIPTDTFRKIIIPLAIGKFLASVSSHVSIWKVPVSYAHTGIYTFMLMHCLSVRLLVSFKPILIFLFIVKATMPLFTVTLSRIFFGETHSPPVYLSLIPIILGVTIATLTEFNFNLTGLISALLATLGFSLQNIFSKRVLKSTGVHQFQLLATLARISLLLFLPFWLLIDGRALFTKFNYDNNVNYESVFILLLFDGLLNFLQNVLAFSVLNIVSPLTYAVCNASKRIFIIFTSLVFFGNKIGVSNFFGMVLALGGVFCYNRAKYIEGKVKVLPLFNNNYQKI